MKFLIDQCLSPALASLLNQAGHDAVHVRDRGMSSATDAEILALADHEDRVLVSADSDFGEILTLGPKRKPSLVLFRGEFDPAAEQQAGRLTSLLPELVVLLESGVIVVTRAQRCASAKPDRVRPPKPRVRGSSTPTSSVPSICTCTPSGESARSSARDPHPCTPSAWP